MSSTPVVTPAALPLSARRETALLLVADYAELCKLRIAALVLVTVGVSGIIAGSYYVSAGNEQIVRLTSRPGA